MRRIQTLEAAPEAYPVSVAECKTHMRVTHTADDTIIEVYLKAAISLVEQILQRKCITQTWKMYLDGWPFGDRISVLFGNLQSVTHVKYTDVDDTQTTFSSDYYYVDTDSVPGRIVLKDDYSWPSDVLRPTNPIEIQFVTGYGDASTDVPDDIRAAIMLMVAHLYENREPVLVSDNRMMTLEKVPFSAMALLQNHRVWEWV